MNGGEPHLLYGHPSRPMAVTVSADWSLIASTDVEGEIHLGPMPDVSRPPLHCLPLDGLRTRIRSFTNARVVASEASPDGYEVQWEPITRWPADPVW